MPAPQKAPMVYGPDGPLVPLGPEGTISSFDTPGTGGPAGLVPVRSSSDPNRPRRSEDEVSALNQRLANDPELQALGQMDPNDQTTRDLWSRYVQRTGLRVPEGYTWNPETRQLDRMSWMERHPFATGALMVGGTLAGGAGLAAMMGPMGAGTLASTAPAFTGAGFAPTVAPVTSGAGGSMGAGSILQSLGFDYTDPASYTRVAGQLGRLGEGQADERGEENQYAQSQDRALADLFRTQQGASLGAAEGEERGKLDRAGFEEGQKKTRSEIGLRAPDVRTRQSILGSLLQELQPVSFGNTGRVKVPTISGGLTPAALNPAARETGSILQKQAIDALLSGSDVPEMTAIPEATDFQAALLPPPTLTPYQGPGRGESILSGVGAGGNILQGILASLGRQSTSNTPNRPTRVGSPDSEDI